MKTLNELALHFGTDKSTAHHGYCDTYERYFAPLRDEPITLLELGFGGYHYPDRGGAGAKMWAEYFQNGTIVTTDIYAKNTVGHNRIFFYQGDQTDGKFLLEVIARTHRPDIIVDDGGHQVDTVIKSFEILFPMLKPGGWYVVEDVHTSYFKDHGYGGGWHDGTSMNYFKRLTDHLNAEHNGLQARPDIQAIHFWKQQVFILKSK